MVKRSNHSLLMQPELELFKMIRIKALALIAFILLFLAGCAGAGNIYTGPVNPQPKQDQAIGIVFNAFNVPFDTNMAPPIVWRFDESCTDSTGTFANTFMMGPGCNYGVYDDNNNLITVEAFGTCSAGSLAHELAHAILYYITGN